MCLDIINLDPLTRLVTRIKQGENVVDEFLVADWLALVIYPAVVSPKPKPYGQCLVEKLWSEGKR